MGACVAALLLWGAFFPGWGPLAWIALVPLLWVLDGAGPRRGAVLGALFGVAFFLLEFSSLLSLSAFVGGLIVPAWLLLSLYAALFCLVFGLVGGWRSSPVAWAGAWVLLEAARGAGPLGFTFGSIPGALVGSPFLRAAAVGGPWLLSLAVAWTGACLARGLRDGRWLPLAALGPGVLLALSFIPAGTQPLGTLRVALVQPNIPKLEQLDGGKVAERENLYRELLAQLSPRVDLVAVPENALPWLLDNPGSLALFQEGAGRLNARLVVGTGVFRDGDVYNTVLVLSPAGEILGSYAKTRLVPFGEYVPGRGIWEGIGLGWILDAALPYDQTPGEAVVPVGDLGIMICFESTLPGVARALVRGGARVLLTPTNDAWFGRTRLLWEHYALGALRAAETGRSFVQVGQTGISGAWDHRGDEIERLPPWTRGTVVLEVPLRTGLTPYVRAGDGPVLGLAGALVVVLMAKRPRSGRGRGGR